MKRVIKNNYKIMIGIIIGIAISLTSVYAIDAYIESKKVTYDNKYTDKNNTQDAIDELYKRSGIHKKRWIDPILNGADPVLKSPLIPVEVKPNGEVYYANLNSEWYNYSEKRWANAVILVDEPSNPNYKVGDHILENDIESYFVWIPRYSYKIWDTGEYNEIISNLTNTKETANSQTALWNITGNSSIIIDVKFVGTDTTDKGSTVGTYLTHPAFQLGNKKLKGIWVGKFETGGTSANDMIVKPNVVSWRNQVLKVFFNAAKGYESELDSHMMKNTEWGAAAYLSHSEYGIGNEVNINNASDYMTGYSATPNTNRVTYPSEKVLSSDETKTKPYNTPVGYLASTTGNITGIYDMSGGSMELVAAYRKNTTGSSTFTQEEIDTQVKAGYIDEYPEDSIGTSFNKRILGDATGEMGPFYKYASNNGTFYTHSSWHSDGVNFVSSTAPWFVRGGYWGGLALSGQFYFSVNSGAAISNYSFRLVLSPTN